MGSETTPAALNSSQLRAVGATLRLVEQAMDEVERLLAEPVTGITFQLVDDLDVKERRAIQAACERVRRILVKACHRLGVEAVERSRRRQIRGKVSALWAMVQDTKSPALGGYGPLSPDVGREVDEVLGELSGVLMGILR
jgi:hypothetical protein